MSESRLVIVGEGDMVSEYKNLAHQLQISEWVIFPGSIGHDELPAYYNLADVEVLPSVDKSEAFGIVLIEAMACAKPVVASNLAGVCSVVNDGENGYLAEAKNFEDLANKIYKLLADHELATRMGQKGREKVVAQYDWQAVVKKIDRIYRSLA